MNFKKNLEDQEKAIYTTLRANTLDEPRTRSVLPNRIKEYGAKWIARLLGETKISAKTGQKIPANQVHAMRVPGYLCAS